MTRTEFRRGSDVRETYRRCDRRGPGKVRRAAKPQASPAISAPVFRACPVMRTCRAGTSERWPDRGALTSPVRRSTAQERPGADPLSSTRPSKNTVMSRPTRSSRWSTTTCRSSSIRCSAAINRQGLTVHITVHPIIRVKFATAAARSNRSSTWTIPEGQTRIIRSLRDRQGDGCSADPPAQAGDP